MSPAHTQGEAPAEPTVISGRINRRGGSSPLPRPAVAGGERTPAELVAEGPVEAVARKSDHRERGLAAADGHTVAGLEGNLDLAVNDQNGRRPFASRDHFVSFMGTVHQRALGQRVAQRGVTTNMWALGGRIGPPAERLCAVEPTGVARIRPSPR